MSARRQRQRPNLPSAPARAYPCLAGDGRYQVRATRTDATGIARRLCAGLGPGQRQARGPLLFRAGRPLSEGGRRRVQPRSLRDGTRRASQQAQGGIRQAGGCTRASPSAARRSTAPAPRLMVSISVQPVPNEGEGFLLVSFSDEPERTKVGKAGGRRCRPAARRRTRAGARRHPQGA